MDRDIIALRAQLLEEWFEPTDAGIIMTWLISSEGRSPVVLVGAGFSRNAHHRHRKDYARRDEVPLWWDVILRMAGDLRVEPGRYDAPTMAEMYASSFGDAALRDMLKDSLRDEDLEPGEAHHALGRYPAEAVVTTNLLDTLLDNARPNQGDGWNIVTTDSDLSAVGPKGTRRPGLIYFHGHRSAPDSWIMTRSQYEDIGRTKPVIVTRVRQLLAQHPLLIVGYSLGDPDFHHLYRQVDNDMRHHHPLGLTIQLVPVPEPERRHWDRLGIRVAIPKEQQRKKLLNDQQLANEFFKWLFKQLETSYSPDMDSVRSHVSAAKDLKARFERFRGVLPHRKKEDSDGYFEKQDEDFRAWEWTLFSVLGKGDQEKARETARDARQFKERQRTAKSRREVATSELNAGPSPALLAEPEPMPEIAPRLIHLPQKWTRVDDELTQQLDMILSRARPFWLNIAQHFRFALERDLFRTQEAEAGFLPWVPLTFWLGTKTLERDSGDLLELAKACIVQARKYGDEHWVRIIEEEAKEARLTAVLEFLQIEEKEAVEEDSPEARGFRAMLEGEPKRAQEQYRLAANLARSKDLPFEEWAWRQGEAQALFLRRWHADHRPEIPDDERASLERDRDILRARIRALRKTDVVRAWRARAAERVKEALEHALEQRASAARYRVRGGRGGRFSSAPHQGWRSFRDLEIIHAPPHMQEEYLAPVLWAQAFEPPHELHYRMIFDLKGTKEWLGQLLDETEAGLHEQRERDGNLVEAFWEAADRQSSKSERLGQLRALPSLKNAFRRGDIPRLPLWLATARKELGPEVKTYGSSVFLNDQFSNALLTVGRLGVAKDVRRLFEEWAKDARQIEEDALAGALNALPWHHWTLRDPEEVLAWVKLAVEWGFASTGDRPSAPANSLPHAGRKEIVLTFALHSMLSELNEVAPSMVDGSLRARLLEFAQAIHQAPIRQGYLWEVRRGGYWLERSILARSTPPAEVLVDRWAGYDGWPPAEQRHLRELKWSLLADALPDSDAQVEMGGASVAIRERLLTSWREVAEDGHWGPTFKHYRLNSYDAGPLVRLLTTCLLFLEEERDAVAARLLPLLQAAPTALHFTAPVLRPDYWGRKWPEFVDGILNSAGGSWGARASDSFEDLSGVAIEHQIAAIDLLARWNKEDDRNAPPTHEAVRSLRGRLVSAALLALSDERTLMANHAAFAVLGAAEVTVDEVEAPVLAQALRRLARDTRVTVRMAAAYAGGRLRRLAKSAHVREAAIAAHDLLATDENALITTQRDLGELEAAVEERRRATDPTTPS